MTIARRSIQRPIFTTMATLIVIILGGISLSRLPIDLMPDITYPTLSILTTYENAGPQEIEEIVTRPIEEAVSAVPGVQEVTSLSLEGTSSTRVTFAWGTDLNAAADDIRDRLDRIMPRLPEEVDRPSLSKFDVASFPIIILGASSKLDPVQMREIIDEQIKYRLERVPGVAAVDVWGGQEREIHVDLHPDRVKALGIGLDRILERIRASNVTMPAGYIDRGNLEVTIRTPGEYTSIEELTQTVIALREGAPVRLQDLASVEDSWQRVRRIVRVNGENGVRLGIRKQSGTNTVEVARIARRELEDIARDFPQIRLTTIIDTSDFIQNSIANVGSSALYGGAFAILIILFFLRNLRSTTIIGTAIPISIIASFALMYFAGFTLNLMTLGGLALGIGMLVDNAIVVLENIYRHREMGEAPDVAADRGTEEVTAAIIASTLTTIVVFLPLVFVRGMAGIMFTQLSLVVSFSLFCSLVVALTLVPMLAAKILGGRAEPAARGVRGALYHGIGRFLNRTDARYRRLIAWALDHRLVVVAVSAAALAASVGLMPFIGVELMPPTDEGEVRISAELEVGSRIALVDATMAKVEAIVRESVPEMRNMVASVGGSPYRPGSTHTGEVRISLVPRSQRTRSSEDVAADLRTRLAGIPGAAIRTRAGQGLFLLRMGVGGTDRVQVEIRGHDMVVANELAHRVKDIVARVTGITDTRLSRESGVPEEIMVIDRAKAADLGVTVSQIAESLQTALSGTRAGYYRERGEEYEIRVMLKDAERLSLADVLDFTLTSATGESVVLRNLVEARPRSGPVAIERKDQERIVVVVAELAGRDMGSVLREIREKLADVPLPRFFSIDFGGDYEEQVRAFEELRLALILSIILVYMVMACQYESLRDPLVVMFSVPLAVIGVTAMLFLTSTTFNVQSYIGCIILGGIVVNNAILLVDHTNLLRRRDGMALREAIEEAGRRRLRPILMTATTTILGLVPLALGLGEGGEAQAPMARTVVGGLLSSTAITLILVPVVYSLFEGMSVRWKRRNGAGANR